MTDAHHFNKLDPTDPYVTLEEAVEAHKGVGRIFDGIGRLQRIETAARKLSEACLEHEGCSGNCCGWGADQAQHELRVLLGLPTASRYGGPLHAAIEEVRARAKGPVDHNWSSSGEFKACDSSVGAALLGCGAHRDDICWECGLEVESAARLRDGLCPRCASKVRR